jgi:hypothetical protein
MKQPILSWDPESRTYKVPHTDSKGNTLAPCGHVDYLEGHCAEMECPNYINKHRH